MGPGELVARSGTTWLMAAVRWEDLYGVPGCVLRFGEVDWADETPQVMMITEEAAIELWAEKVRQSPLPSQHV